MNLIRDITIQVQECVSRPKIFDARFVETGRNIYKFM